MSQLENGSELMGGMGGSGANALVDANEGRYNIKDFEIKPVFYAGIINAGMTRGKSTRPYDRIVKFVEIVVEGDFQPANALTFQLVVNGTTLSQAYALAIAGLYAYVAVAGDGNGGSNPFATVPSDSLSGPGVLVLANQTLQVIVATISGQVIRANDVYVNILSRRRVL